MKYCDYCGSKLKRYRIKKAIYLKCSNKDCILYDNRFPEWQWKDRHQFNAVPNHTGLWMVKKIQDKKASYSVIRIIEWETFLRIKIKSKKVSIKQYKKIMNKKGYDHIEFIFICD